MAAQFIYKYKYKYKIKTYNAPYVTRVIRNKNLTKIYNLTNKLPMEHSNPNAHAIRNSNRHAR